MKLMFVKPAFKPLEKFSPLDETISLTFAVSCFTSAVIDVEDTDPWSSSDLNV